MKQLSPYQFRVLKYLVENPKDYRRPTLERIAEAAGIENAFGVIPKNLAALQRDGFLDDNHQPTPKAKKLIRELDSPPGKTEKSRGATEDSITKRS